MRLYEITSEPFVLHPSLDLKKYNITNSFRDINPAGGGWTAYCYNGDNRYKKGSFAPVGYTMISLVDNTIVPISRTDEHHTGYDHMYDLKIPRPNDYVSIWAGNNYLYDVKEIPKYLAAFKKWIQWGGGNTVIIGANSLSKVKTTVRDFLKSNGDVTIKQGELAPIGRNIYQLFKELALVCNQHRDSDKLSDKNKILLVAKKIVKEMRTTYLSEAISYDINNDLKKFDPKTFETIQEIEEYFFGFGGIKNKMHNAIKHAYETNSWEKRDFEATWGDLPLAINMLANF